MKATSGAVALFLVLVLPQATLQAVRLRLLDDPLARCLDGSNAGFYFRSSQLASKKNSWIIHLQGGGECVSASECSRKLNAPLASSKFFPPEINLTWDSSGCANQSSVEASWGKFGWWLCDGSSDSNPDFFGFNHVWLPYCSQDLWSGRQTNWTNLTGNLNVIYAGHFIFKAVLNRLDDLGLKNAELIILSGNSAGGMGVWLHVDMLAQRYKKAQVVGVAIAGYYAFSYPYDGPHAEDPSFGLSDFTESSWANYVKLWNAYMNQECATALGNFSWACMVSNYSFPFVKSPMFAAESLSDQAQLQWHNRIPMSVSYWSKEVYDYIHEYQQNMTQALHAFYSSDVKHNGVFAPACFIHDNFTVGQPVIDGLGFKDVIANWLGISEGPKVLFDRCGSMCNPSCQTGPAFDPSDAPARQRQRSRRAHRRRERGRLRVLEEAVLRRFWTEIDSLLQSW
ncbi:hypothetical protein GUITHDRAFT_160713 [Guillardia theta CCMP2712]|uniref:Pectin acetylesterase n=1 Tax=Guillardia theta (strain CCMP2712) TaxID=905079 RepID=L1K167_GUITC|nr:hypothetical protein GUITHDRAFT_160713 [Guillardia theta CCMP2712]EKX54596.1 hypothetical protein GUITHDRAFT_160713 [Guillardia theta CCMP2712]|eukprot:XP_005841576.1 hypothetical protein GUITHDRAFT_160713 [Guillardia theta CCMP2712]